jgi:hypothetical protein
VSTTYLAESVVPVLTVASWLDAHHYLGRTHRGIAWSDDLGVLVLAPPTSRQLPADWLELSRWCLERGNPNGGSRQWKRVRRWLLANHPATTVVSYSDPAQGHTGALYRACGWLWAPTWQRLRPPPSGNGSWTPNQVQHVKDRWVCPLRPDPRRAQVLAVQDEALVRAGCPQYVEPDRFRRAPGVAA